MLHDETVDESTLEEVKMNIQNAYAAYALSSEVIKP
jgi:hypothetical protein